MDPLRAVIRHFDDWLSRREGVTPFTDDPDVILRVQVSFTPHALILPDRTIPAGAETLLLHAWNERMPVIPAEGPDFAYGFKLHQLTIASINAVARHIMITPSLQNIQAIGGVTVHISLKEADGGRVMLERLGFTVMLYQRPFGAFGEFWENFYTWWLMWTFNPASTRHRRLWILQRTEFWMTSERFLEKYGT